MKIAISGKGGVGKSTVAAALALHFAKKGGRVLALDADPDANLASALGIPQAEQDKMTTIAREIDLIEERTDSKVNEYGRVFKLNPEVSDVADKYAYTKDGVSLLVLGAIQNGGAGCACAESTFLRALVTDLVLFKNETLIMDMEAGIEHLGRATAKGVDLMIVVVEPGKRSIDCAHTVKRMSGEIGVKKVVYVGNKIDSPEDEAYILEALAGEEILAMIPYSNALRSADRDGLSVLDTPDKEILAVFDGLFQKIEVLL
jgi:CO dehydrogenase maturation factor